jgi:hypothetical protein
MRKMEISADRFVLIVVAIVALASIVISLNTMTNDKEIEFPEPIFCHQSQDCVDFLNEFYVSENEWFHHNVILNDTFKAIESDLESAGVAITTMQNKFIIVEHATDVPTTTPDSLAKCAGDFDLKTLKITGEFEDRFLAGQTVFIRGDYKDGIMGDYKITRGSEVVKSQNMQTGSDGSFLGTFNDQQNQPTGQYTAEFQLGGLSDCISFYLE